jgi:hypothetical protein
MKVCWLIDADIFGESYRNDLVGAIRDQGHYAKIIHAPSPPFRWDDVGCSYRETFPADACVVAHGDIELVTRIREERRWTPGAFCTVENFFCSSYACRFGKYLLNRDYVMLPFGELDRRKEFLFETFGREGRIFVRPDSPLKLFTGQVASRETFAADLEYMAFYEFPENSIVLVSSPHTILNEWRFVIARGRVVAGCQYKCDGQLEYLPDYDERALELAQEIAAVNYEPDPAWVMDICKTADGAYHLLEIGGFSFADLYACNKSDIVAAVSAAAAGEWQQAQNKSTAE